jgi:diacylglycerol kinase family enzyme
MHIYIYDDFLEKSRYNKTLNKIETRLTDLGLSGKIVRLNNLKNSDKAIKEEVKQGAKTVVAVGGDKTFSKVINVLMSNDLSFFVRNIVIAFIPVGNSSLAETFGLNNYQQACDILLARRLKTIFLAKCNTLYFISNIKINGENAEIQINENYQVTLLRNNTAYIINVPSRKILDKIPNIKEIDENKLYLYIENNKQDFSFIPANKLKIKNQKNLFLSLDSCLNCEESADISLSDKQIRLIVGKNRAF